MKRRFFAWCLSVIITTGVTAAFAEQVSGAVAANFVLPFRDVAVDFEKATGHYVRAAADPTGNFYFYIHNGTPFDVFFPADVERSKLVEAEGAGVKDSRFTYTVGTSDPLEFQPRSQEERTLSSKEFRCQGEVASSCALRSSWQEPVQ